jgi:hypothetical protein
VTPVLITLNVNRLEIDAFKAALAVVPALITQLQNQYSRRTLARSHRPQQLNMG